MSSSRETVQQWFDLIAKGDAKGAFALFTDDITYALKGTTPVSGVYHGMQQIVEDFFTPWRKQIVGEIVLTVDELIGDGDCVVALARGKAKTIHGLPYDNDYAFVFRLRDGKIKEVIEYLDTALVDDRGLRQEARLSGPADADREPPQVGGAETVDRTRLARLGAKRTIEPDCGLVPVEDGPLESNAAALERRLSKVREKALAETLPAPRRFDEDVLEVQARGPEKRGEGWKEDREGDRLRPRVPENGFGNRLGAE